MEKFNSSSCSKWSFDQDEVPTKCRVRRRRQEEEFLQYVKTGRSCMIVGLPGSGRHVFSVMMQEELEKAGIEVKTTTFANLGTGDTAFQRMMEILGLDDGVDLSGLTLGKAKDAFVQKLKNRVKERDGALCLFIDSFDSCCRLQDREEFLVQFFDTNEGEILWRKAGFVPILISTRTPKMIVKYRPGMGSPFERHYQQHCIDMKPFGLKEVEDFCGCSKRTIAYGDMELLLKQVGPWPGLLRMVLSNYNSHREISMGEVLQCQDVKQQLGNYYSQLADFFAKFGKGFGLAEGVTLFDCLSALAADKSLPQSKTPRSIYELFMEYGLISRKDDDAPYVCNVSELGVEYIKRIRGVGVDFVEEKKRRASSGVSHLKKECGVVLNTNGRIRIDCTKNGNLQVLSVKFARPVEKEILGEKKEISGVRKYTITNQNTWNVIDRLLSEVEKEGHKDGWIPWDTTNDGVEVPSRIFRGGRGAGLFYNECIIYDRKSIRLEPAIFEDNKSF